MLATKLIWFYLCLVAFSQVISSTRVNKTSSDGKVFISGDHNEVFLTGTVREIKIALAEIKGVLKSVKKKDEELSKKIQALEKANVLCEQVECRAFRAGRSDLSESSCFGRAR